MNQNSKTFAIVSVLGAVLAWGVVGYMVWQIGSMQNSRADLLDKVQQATTRQTTAARTHALLQDTSAERATLADTSRVDVLSVVNSVESIGKSAGVVLEVKGAQPGTLIPARAGVTPLRPINFTIQGSGSFSGVMHALAMLEHMPYPTEMSQIEIFRTALDENTSSTAESWHIGVTLKLLTTSDVSS